MGQIAPLDIKVDTEHLITVSNYIKVYICWESEREMNQRELMLVPLIIIIHYFEGVQD